MSPVANWLCLSVTLVTQGGIWRHGQPVATQTQPDPAAVILFRRAFPPLLAGWPSSHFWS